RSGGGRNDQGIAKDAAGVCRGDCLDRQRSRRVAGGIYFNDSVNERERTDRFAVDEQTREARTGDILRLSTYGNRNATRQVSGFESLYRRSIRSVYTERTGNGRSVFGLT